MGLGEGEIPNVPGMTTKRARVPPLAEWLGRFRRHVSRFNPVDRLRVSRLRRMDAMKSQVVRQGQDFAQEVEGTLPVFPQITLEPLSLGRTITPLPGSK